jgi:hypothetical protein
MIAADWKMVLNLTYFIVDFSPIQHHIKKIESKLTLNGQTIFLLDYWGRTNIYSPSAKVNCIFFVEEVKLLLA